MSRATITLLYIYIRTHSHVRSNDEVYEVYGMCLECHHNAENTSNEFIHEFMTPRELNELSACCANNIPIMKYIRSLYLFVVPNVEGRIYEAIRSIGTASLALHSTIETASTLYCTITIIHPFSIQSKFSSMR